MSTPSSPPGHQWAPSAPEPQDPSPGAAPHGILFPLFRAIGRPRPLAPLWERPHVRWTAIGVSALLLALTLGAAVYFQSRAPVPTNYVELYFTDLPVELDRLELRVSAVYVGLDNENPLRLEVPVFDILAYHGPDQAFRLAYGEVPETADFTELRVEFENAYAHKDGHRADVFLPKGVLRINPGFDLGESDASAVLFDVDLDKSLILTDRGLTFRPHVGKVFYHDYTTGENRQEAFEAVRGNLHAAPPFSQDPSLSEPAQFLDDAPPTTGGGRSSRSSTTSTPPGTTGTEPEGGIGTNTTTSTPTPCQPTCLPAPPTSNSWANEPGNDVEELMRLVNDTERFVGELPGALTENAMYIVRFVQDQAGQGPLVPQQENAFYAGSPDSYMMTTSSRGSWSEYKDPEFWYEEAGDVSYTASGVVLRGENGKRMRDVIEASGGEVLYQFLSMPAMAVTLSPSEAFDLLENAAVDEIWYEAGEVAFASMASAQFTSEYTRLLQNTPPLVDTNGRAINGVGIGVAVVDTGIDGTHPDLCWDAKGATGGTLPLNGACVTTSFATPLSRPVVLAKNYKVGPAVAGAGLVFVNVPNSDTTSGHGTHVAGIVAGQLSQTVQGQRGFATGATLYGFGVGETAQCVGGIGCVGGPLWVDVALDHILAFRNAYNPPIRVVSLSAVIGGTTYNPSLLTNQLVASLVANGVVVAVAAGNGGGNGFVSQTNQLCLNPVSEGLLCVGNYDDRESEGYGFDRSQGKTAISSSRGSFFAPQTWPDLVAPGQNVKSARGLIARDAGFTNAVLVQLYTDLSGTSQATPIAAATAALVLQSNPLLTPAQVEDTLEVTAYKYSADGSYAVSTDPRYDGSHWAKGKGLVDVYAAVGLALSG